MAKKKKQDIPVKTQLAVVTGAVCLLVLFGVFVAWLDRSVVKTAQLRTYADVTIRGTSVCLPAVDNSSARADGTMCIQGLKTKGGAYYQLDGTINRKDDNTIEVTGTLAPPKATNFVSDGVLTVK